MTTSDRFGCVSRHLLSWARTVWFFFRRLQWRLTLSYALFTALTALIFGVVGSAFLWYLTFWEWIPTGVASDLMRSSGELAVYLESTPADVVGLNEWLLSAMVADLGMGIQPGGGAAAQGGPGNGAHPEGAPADDGPKATGVVDSAAGGGGPVTGAVESGGPAGVGPADGGQAGLPLLPPTPPVRFGRVVSVAVVDAAGKVVLGYPVEDFPADAALSVPDEAQESVRAALDGKRNPAELAIRSRAGNILAVVPISGNDRHLVGAIYVETTSPILEWSMLKDSVRQSILPIVLNILLGGIVAGVFFGYFIARGLTGRLNTLAGAADAWSQGDFEVVVSDSSGDELGQLTHRLNHMALELQTLIQTRQELAMLGERNRLSRDLHDAVKQQLFATAMQVGAALALFEQDPAAAKSRLVEADHLVHQTQGELSALIQELRPASLEDKGLVAALRDYVADWGRQNNIAVDMRVRGDQVCPLVLEQTLFRVAQEALANVARHSGASSVEVLLAWEADQITLEVSDNGKGFTPEGSARKGLGLRNMRERMDAAGGQIWVTSRPGEGTRVAVRCTTPKV